MSPELTSHRAEFEKTGILRRALSPSAPFSEVSLPTSLSRPLTSPLPTRHLCCHHSYYGICTSRHEGGKMVSTHGRNIQNQ
jgi:hypothetical protein